MPTNSGLVSKGEPTTYYIWDKPDLHVSLQYYMPNSSTKRIVKHIKHDENDKLFKLKKTETQITRHIIGNGAGIGSITYGSCYLTASNCSADSGATVTANTSGPTCSCSNCSPYVNKSAGIEATTYTGTCPNTAAYDSTIFTTTCDASYTEEYSLSQISGCN
jgi:hypothetical protein